MQASVAGDEVGTGGQGGVIPGGGDSLGDAQIQISWPLWIF